MGWQAGDIWMISLQWVVAYVKEWDFWNQYDIRQSRKNAFWITATASIDRSASLYWGGGGGGGGGLIQVSGVVRVTLINNIQVTLYLNASLPPSTSLWFILSANTQWRDLVVPVDFHQPICVYIFFKIYLFCFLIFGLLLFVNKIYFPWNKKECLLLLWSTVKLFFFVLILICPLWHHN